MSALGLVASEGALSNALAEGLDATPYDVDAALPAGLTGVVVVVGADPPPTPANVVNLDEASWLRQTHLPMERTLRALQRSQASMLVRGGRIVTVLPTLGIPGASQLVPYTAT